ncbi:hypothetical protein [Buttiauxella sp. A2-C1_F]|uniref:hypothetical protein n=1 Tax=Buttiauxella sp. A2-C1_F TaxID=2904526 RepID=UPI00351D7134
MESYVLSLLLQEKDLCYIAVMSTLSVKTINAHKRPIMKKVHVKKIVKLVEKIVFKPKPDNLLLELSREKLDLVRSNDTRNAVVKPMFDSVYDTDSRRKPDKTDRFLLTLLQISRVIQPLYCTSILKCYNITIHLYLQSVFL